jgi:hypothetical protein
VIQQNVIYICDGCGSAENIAIINGVMKLPVGWGRVKFVPGILSNTKPRPDKHACSDKCRDFVKKEFDRDIQATMEAEMAAVKGFHDDDVG